MNTDQNTQNNNLFPFVEVTENWTLEIFDNPDKTNPDFNIDNSN